MSLPEQFPTVMLFGRFLGRCGRFLRRCVKPVFFTLVCLVTLIALFVAEENYRSGKAWENYQAEAKARGEKLTLAELVPPPVPDDQNFAMTPLLKLIFSKPKPGEPSLDQRFSLYYNAPPESPDLGQWETGQHIDLVKWAVYLKQADVLAALQKYSTDMAEVSAASRRPYSRFPIPYDWQPASNSRPNMEYAISLLRLTSLFTLRAMAELDAGQNDQALNDTVTVFHLAQSNKDDLMLTSQLTSEMELNDGVQIVWEGLAANRWTDSQLAALDQEMQKIDLFPQIRLTLIHMRATYFEVAEWSKGLSYVERVKFLKQRGSTELTIADELMIYMPSFVYNLAQLEVARYYDEFVLPSINASARRIYPQLAGDGEQMEVDQLNNRNYLFHPQAYYEHVPAWTSQEVQFARTQTDLDEATVACALERFKMAHGDYPAKLRDLVPEFMAKLPHDITTGEPLHYQRASDGRYMIYSVGWDEKDDHGTPATFWDSEKAGKDWVWQYQPAKIMGK